MICPLSSEGFSLSIYKNSHKHTSVKTVHLSTYKKLHVPFGCFILFHKNLLHGTCPTKGFKKNEYSLERLFCYITEKAVEEAETAVPAVPPILGVILPALLVIV